MIEDKQTTICIHVYDRSGVIEWLREEYESTFKNGSGENTVSQGKVH